MPSYMRPHLLVPQKEAQTPNTETDEVEAQQNSAFRGLEHIENGEGDEEEVETDETDNISIEEVSSDRLKDEEAHTIVDPSFVVPELFQLFFFLLPGFLFLFLLNFLSLRLRFHLTLVFVSVVLRILFHLILTSLRFSCGEVHC